MQYFFVHTAQLNREVNIMPNRLFQGIVNQMREAIDRNIGVVDETGTVIACSELGLIGEIRKGVISAGVFSTNQTCVDNATFLRGISLSFL